MPARFEVLDSPALSDRLDSSATMPENVVNNHLRSRVMETTS